VYCDLIISSIIKESTILKNSINFVQRVFLCQRSILILNKTIKKTSLNDFLEEIENNILRVEKSLFFLKEGEEKEFKNYKKELYQELLLILKSKYSSKTKIEMISDLMKE
jgi:hypothetical protein